MPYRVGVIAGTGLSRLFGVDEEVSVDTPYGIVALYSVTVAGRQLIFLPRHGVAHSIPPHQINYQANIFALKKTGCKAVVATSAVGSLNETIKPGDFVVVNQFLDFTKSRKTTFFDGRNGKVMHVDVTDPYDSRLQSLLFTAGRRSGFRLHNHGVYACTEGPRFETPAEIRTLKRLGADVVGMTGVQR